MSGLKRYDVSSNSFIEIKQPIFNTQLDFINLFTIHNLDDPSTAIIEVLPSGVRKLVLPSEESIRELIQNPSKKLSLKPRKNKNG